MLPVNKTYAPYTRLRLKGIRRNLRPETGHLIRAEPFNRRIHREAIVYIFCSLAYK